MRRAFKYRLYPTRALDLVLGGRLTGTRRLYNAALQQRIWAGQDRRGSLRYLDRAKDLEEARDGDPNLSLLNYSCCQDLLRRLEKAFNACFPCGPYRK